MRLLDLLYLLDRYQLVCIENESGDCIYCGEMGEAKFFEVRELTVKTFYPESYGKYNGQHGITFIVEGK